MSRFLKIFFSLMLFIWPAFVAVNLASADDVTFTPQVSIPGSNFEAQKDITVSNDTAMICDYVIAFYKYGIAIVGIFAVLAIAMGGVMWIVAAGNSGTIGEGKQWIISGFLGLILALSSFILLATINKDLVTCHVNNIPGITGINSSSKGNKTQITNSTPQAVIPTAACIAWISYNGDEQDCGNDLFIDSPISNCNNMPEFQTYPKSKCCCPNKQKYDVAYLCQSASEGDTCMTGAYWGYCENKTCKACRQPTAVLYDANNNNTRLTLQEFNNIPEINRCYRNSKNYECQHLNGSCGNNVQGNCIMYSRNSVTGEISNANPVYASTHACNQGNDICVCEIF